MKIILHIGTHKTGTTAIQRALSQNRSKLLAHGVWYPHYSEVIGGEKQSYAHLDIAKAIMGEKALLNRKEAELFLRSLHAKAKEIKNVDTVLISGETLLRAKMGPSGKKWDKIQHFQRFLSDCLAGFEDIQVSVTFRGYIDYLESLYNEHIKATGYSKSILSFHKEYGERFKYRSIVQTWEKNVGSVKVLTFSELTQGNMIATWANKVLGHEVGNTLDIESAAANPSWQLPVVELKRKLNSLNDRVFSNQVRTHLDSFNESEYVKQTFPDKFTWLTPEQKLSLVDGYQIDQDWLTENCNELCADFCKVSGKEKRVFNSLEEATLLEFVKFNLDREE